MLPAFSSTYHPNDNQKKILYTGRIRFFPMVCTIGPIHYLPIRKKKENIQPEKQVAITCLSNSADILFESTYLWMKTKYGLIVQVCGAPSFKVKFTFLWQKGGGDGQNKGKKILPCLYYGRNSNSSTLMTFAGMEGRGCSSTSDPNHLARPSGGVPMCCWGPFVR